MAFVIANALAGICLIISLVKDRKKTVKALIIALKTGKEMLPLVIIIMVAIGLLIGFTPEGSLTRLLNSNLGILGIPIMAIAGSLVFLPAPVIFPLIASIFRSISAGGGAGFYGVAAIAAFVTCNTMVCSSTIPLEIKIMGSRSAVVRILGDFAAAMVITVIVGVILRGYQL